MIRRPWRVRVARLAHPLPFLAVLVLVFTSYQRPLLPAQWAVVGVYVVYLLPYVAISHYERYGLPLLGLEVLLVVWACDRLLCLRSDAGGAQRSGSMLRGWPKYSCSVRSR